MIRCVVWGRNKTWDYAYTDRIHIWYIYPLTYHENQPNVGTYTSPVKRDITVIHAYLSTNHWLTRPSWRCFNCGSPGITMLWLMWHFRNLIEVLDRNSTLWTCCFFDLKLPLRRIVLHRSTRTKCTQPNKGMFAIHIFVNKYLARPCH